MSDTIPPDAAPQGTSETGQGLAAATPFHSVTFPDGKTESFATADDLTRALQESYLRRSDYTRKTQELGNQRKQHEQERKEFEEQVKAIQKDKQKYDTYAERLKGRPDVARQLEALASGAASPGDLLTALKSQMEEAMKPIKDRVDSFEKEREAEKLDRKLEEMYGKLSKEYPDFNRQAVEDLLQELSSGNTEALVRMAYNASRGMLSPAQQEQRMAVEREKRAVSGMPPSGNAPRGKSGAFKTVDDATEAALKEWAGKK